MRASRPTALVCAILLACLAWEADPDVYFYCSSQCEGSISHECHDTCMVRECEKKCANAPTRQCQSECIGDANASCSAMFPGFE